jgi:polyphosphate kinase 2 (PPK2 family)
MSYFERAVISNDYFEKTLISKTIKMVKFFQNIQHNILLSRVTLI